MILDRFWAVLGVRKSEQAEREKSDEREPSPLALLPRISSVRAHGLWARTREGGREKKRGQDKSKMACMKETKNKRGWQ